MPWIANRILGIPFPDIQQLRKAGMHQGHQTRIIMGSALFIDEINGILR